MIIVWCIALAFFPAITYAQIVITEVMYDVRSGSDSGREWIEIVNVGSSVIDLTTWKLVENGMNHKISAGSKSLTPGSYAIIADNPAKFSHDWPSYTGIVFDSTFSLGNDGDVVALKMGTETIDSVAFSPSDGGDGTGDSLQRSATDAPFDFGIPTPGAGVPLGGLQKSPPKESKSSAKSREAALVPVRIEIMGDPVVEAGTSLPQIGAAAAHGHRWYWWFAPFGIACIGFIGISWSRHHAKDEWDIIEEDVETS